MNKQETLTLRQITRYSGALGTIARYNWIHVRNQTMPKQLETSDNMFLGFANLDVFVTPPPVPGRRKHRMKVNLPCGRTISAGRLLQHGEACQTCKTFMTNL
jgi:hypothetical protein